MKKTLYYGWMIVFASLWAHAAFALQLQKAAPIRLATGMQFTEGPAWHPKGYLIFSDIDGNVLYRWNPSKGLDTLVYPSGNANGNLYAKPYPFLVCQQGRRAVSALNERGTLTPLIEQFRGKKLNSPNDLERSTNGNIYFTDPDFGFNAKTRELPFQGFFLLPAGKGEAVLLDSTLNWPNGLAFTKDGKSLLLCESKTNLIYRYALSRDGRIANKSVFVHVTGNGLVDGIATDKEGNLFVAFNRGGVVVFSATGTELGRIAFPPGEDVRNLCLGGKDGNTLFVTAGKSLYKVDLR
jgi:gluconolactonase